MRTMTRTKRNNAATRRKEEGKMRIKGTNGEFVTCEACGDDYYCREGEASEDEENPGVICPECGQIEPPEEEEEED